MKKIILYVVCLMLIMTILYSSTNKENVLVNDSNIISTYDSTYASDESIKFSEMEKGKNGTDTALKIESSEYSESSMSFKFDEGEAYQFYVISAWIKTSGFSMKHKEGNGIAIVVNDDSDYNCKYIFSDMITQDTSSISDNDDGWVKVKRVVKLDSQGSIYFCIQGGWGDNMSKGTILIDQVKVDPVKEENEYVMYTSTEGDIRMVFKNSDVVSSGITDDNLHEWLDLYSKIRKSMKWMIGGSEPYEGTTDYILTERFAYYGLAGNPIYINSDFVTRDLKRIELDVNSGQNNVLWGFIHEMGHTFDGVDSESITMRWVFDSEFFATLKSVYCLNINGYGMGNDRYTGELIINHFSESASLDSGVYSTEGFIYRLMQIMDSCTDDGGRTALHDTFIKFNELSNEDIPTTNSDKFILFIELLSQSSGSDVRNKFTDSEWTTLSNKFCE